MIFFKLLISKLKSFKLVSTNLNLRSRNKTTSKTDNQLKLGIITSSSLFKFKLINDNNNASVPEPTVIEYFDFV